MSPGAATPDTVAGAGAGTEPTWLLCGSCAACTGRAPCSATARTDTARADAPALAWRRVGYQHARLLYGFCLLVSARQGTWRKASRQLCRGRLREPGCAMPHLGPDARVTCAVLCWQNRRPVFSKRRKVVRRYDAELVASALGVRSGSPKCQAGTHGRTRGCIESGRSRGRSGER